MACFRVRHFEIRANEICIDFFLMDIFQFIIFLGITVNLKFHPLQRICLLLRSFVRVPVPEYGQLLKSLFYPANKAILPNWLFSFN